MYHSYSVLMSVYVKENPYYLKQSIDSMLNQTIQTNDFVIVEDGILTKKLQMILDKYADDYPFIHLIKRNENSGLGAALNVGIKYCKNELVARMDSDDISHKLRCEKQLREFNIDNNLGIVGTDIARFSGEIDNILSIKRMPQTCMDIYQFGKQRNPFNHPSVMFKKSIIIENGGYPESIRGEDFALFTKMISRGIKGKNIGEPLLYYRTDYNQFIRRTSWDDTKAVIKVAHRNRKERYCSLWDFIKVVVRQVGSYIVTRNLGGGGIIQTLLFAQVKIRA